MYSHKFLEVKAGAPRRGKSFHAEAVAKAYMASGNGPVFLYNAGKPTDFSAFTTIRPLEFWEMCEMIHTDKKEQARYKSKGKPLTHFIIEDGPQKGNVHDFKDFCTVFWCKGVKMYSNMEYEEDKEVFKAVFDYMPCTYFILDDAGAILQHGVPKFLTRICNSNNHVGKKCAWKEIRGLGADVSIMSHALEEVNNKLWRFMTHVTLFYTHEKPPNKFVNDSAKEDILLEGWKYLKEAPLYSALAFDVSSHPPTVKHVDSKQIKLINEKY